MKKKSFPAPSPKEHLVIIGGGMVSHYFLRQAVRLNLHQKMFISVLCEEDLPPYDRIHLTEAFETLDPSPLILSPLAWYSEHGIRLYTKAQVVGVQFREKKIRLANAEGDFKYNHLIFATGSRPFVPPLKGLNGPNIFYYRNFNDLQNIRSATKVGAKALVMGGGLLGLEAGRALHQSHMEVHLVEYADYLLPRQLQPKSSALLKRLIENSGLNIHLGAKAQGVIRKGDQLLLQFEKKPPLEGELLVIAAGVKPRDELAHICGLKVDFGGGIEVNSLLETSEPDVYAMGDCVNFAGYRFGLAAPGFRMAEIIAQKLAGKNPSPFTHQATLDTSLKFAGVEVTVMGDYLRPHTERYVYESDSHYRMIVCRGTTPIGLVQVGEWKEVPHLQEMIQSKTSIGESKLIEFAQSGVLIREGHENGIESMHDDAILCNCMSVSKGKICEAIAAGCQTAEEIGLRTGAGMVCGSCKPHLQKLTTEQPSEIKSTRSKGLALLSTGIGLLVIAALFLPQIAHAHSVQSPYYEFQKWWTRPLLQQISGYTAAGFTLLGLSLSLRKRFRKFHFGNFVAWRWTHALLSLAALLAYAFHSGNQWGHGLNSSLSSIFIAMQLSGSLAGIHCGWHGDVLNSRQRIIRQRLINLHLLLFVLLPALLFFHLLLPYMY